MPGLLPEVGARGVAGTGGRRGTHSRDGSFGVKCADRGPLDVFLPRGARSLVRLSLWTTGDACCFLSRARSWLQALRV